MIKLLSESPDIIIDGIETFKIKSDCEIYSDTTAVFESEEGGMISFAAGGACVISGKQQSDELCAFLKILSPTSILTDEENARKITLKDYKAETVTVLRALPDFEGSPPTCDINSETAYRLLSSVPDFALPPYELFAVDYCRRKNKGALLCGEYKGKALAVAFVCKDAALLCGVVSMEKGCGGRALQNCLKNLSGKTVYAAAKEEVVPFYVRHSFSPYKKAVYFEKQKG